jgi:hypothetical protein
MEVGGRKEIFVNYGRIVTADCEVWKKSKIKVRAAKVGRSAISCRDDDAIISISKEGSIIETLPMEIEIPWFKHSSMKKHAEDGISSHTPPSGDWINDILSSKPGIS